MLGVHQKERKKGPLCFLQVLVLAITREIIIWHCKLIDVDSNMKHFLTKFLGSVTLHANSLSIIADPNPCRASEP